MKKRKKGKNLLVKRKVPRVGAYVSAFFCVRNCSRERIPEEPMVRDSA
jgi:hypothetical protein